MYHVGSVSVSCDEWLKLLETLNSEDAEGRLIASLYRRRFITAELADELSYKMGIEWSSWINEVGNVQPVG